MSEATRHYVVVNKLGKLEYQQTFTRKYQIDRFHPDLLIASYSYGIAPTFGEALKMARQRAEEKCCKR